VERAVVMTGIGGQGIQLIAKVLAQAGIREGREVMMFGIFMGMIRGGSSESTVVIADRPIVAPPIVPKVWAVLAMHPEGLPKLAAKMEAGGVLVCNSSLVVAPPAWDGVRQVAVPATELAKAVGQPMGASMIALGAFAGATGIVSVESLHAALGEVLPPHRRKLIDANQASISRGAEYVRQQAACDGVHAWA
jgi:Pyruvate/2-oxoacid:ferredoxin oxidoreductase gamma subunit